MKKAAPFTKELKQKWLEALKSGKFTQGFTNLYNVDENTHCCIGVLSEIHPDLPNLSELEKSNSVCPYNYLTENNIDVERIWLTNDDYPYKRDVAAGEQKRDYSNVIPLIEELPTVD